jgi:hypothetical protein
MKRIMFLKIAAVLSAIVLVGGLVSYRAGAFDKLFSPPETPPEQQTEPEPTPEPETPPSAQSDLDALLMSTSKSAGVLIPPKKSAPKSETTAPPKQQIMPGSKSLAPLIPPKSPADAPK